MTKQTRPKTGQSKRGGKRAGAGRPKSDQPRSKQATATGLRLSLARRTALDAAVTAGMAPNLTGAINAAIDLWLKTVN